MNWSRTKLIFLIAFLVLDLYLGFQLYDKRKSAELPTASGEVPPKEQLKNSQIEYPPNLPQIENATYIKGKTMSFVTQSEAQETDSETTNMSVDKDLRKADKKTLKPEIRKLQLGPDGKKIQQISVGTENTVISSDLSEPVDVPKNGDFTAFLNTYVYKGSEYHPWKEKVTDSGRSFIFVQTYNERPVFSKSQSLGTLQVHVNNGKIVGYRQIYLHFEPYNKDEKKNIIPQINAVYNLYLGNYLPYGSTVKIVKLGYYNLIERDLGNVKIFVPAWHVLVQTENEAGEQIQKEYFVNAITGVVQTLQKQEKDTG